MMEKQIEIENKNKHSSIAQGNELVYMCNNTSEIYAG